MCHRWGVRCHASCVSSHLSCVKWNIKKIAQKESVCVFVVCLSFIKAWDQALPVLPLCQGQGRDKKGKARTNRDKKGQAWIRQGQAGTRQGLTGTKNKQGQSMSVPVCPCLPMLVPVFLGLSLSVPVCPCLSLSVNVQPCLSLSFQVCHRLSLFVPGLVTHTHEARKYCAAPESAPELGAAGSRGGSWPALRRNSLAQVQVRMEVWAYLNLMSYVIQDIKYIT